MKSLDFIVEFRYNIIYCRKKGGVGALAVKESQNESLRLESFSEYAYLRIYEFFYMAGMLFLRQMRGSFHFVVARLCDLKDWIIGFFRHAFIHIRTSFHNFIVGQYHTLLAYRKQAEDSIAVLKRDKEISTSEKFSAIGKLIRCWASFVFKVFGSIFNYLGPIFALFFLIITIQYFLNLDYGLALRSGNKTLAYVKSEDVYTEAEQIVRNRTSTEVADIGNVVPEYAIVPVSSLKLTEPEDLANILLSNSGTNIYEGYGFYIDDKFIGSTDEVDSLLLVLDEYREQYREEGDTESKLQFVQKISMVDGIYPTSSIKATSEFKTLLNTQIEGEKYYTVEAGDAPSTISDDYGISVRELYNMNPGLEGNDIHVGEQLVVSRSVSYLNVTTTRREVYNEEIPYTTNYTYSDKYYTTFSKVTKAGIPGEQEVTALVTYEDGIPVSRQVLATKVLTEPVPREVTKGTKNVIYSVGNAAGTKKGFIWPTIGGYVSCRIWGYKGHTGMDIAGCGKGSNIYASAAGTVVTVKWGKTGYGNHIIINHGDGVQTLYAHLNDIYVTKNQYVNQGDVIGAMGRTGNATGVHLHFEIRINGQYIDPGLYIGYAP